MMRANVPSARGSIRANFASNEGERAFGQGWIQDFVAVVAEIRRLDAARCRVPAVEEEDSHQFTPGRNWISSHFRSNSTTGATGMTEGKGKKTASG